ncbi:hypothetical protein [Streptomyces celluloflavus]|uniref:hypothetical protein n=1 Tax=Streptomyces celluloflavus TaxID=58344 RepID=UPI003676EB1E
MRPPLLLPAVAAVLLITTAGCVSVPAGGPVRAPVLAPDGRTVAPVWPSPTVAPHREQRQEQPREQLVTVRGLTGRPAHAPGAGTARAAGPVRAAPAHRRERPPRRVRLPRARVSVRSPEPVRKARQGRHGVPARPWLRASAEAGVVCRMASGRVGGELLRACRRMFGG